MSKSTKSSKRAKMLKLKNNRSVAKSVSLKHLSILKCLSLQNPLRTECACFHVQHITHVFEYESFILERVRGA